MTTKVNQKEYLKKYLSSDKSNKKKKKRSKQITGQTVKIIDDDIDLSKLQNINEDEIDLMTIGEDAPQIVGVIDDRPPELIAEDFKNSTKWKVVSNNDGFNQTKSGKELNKTETSKNDYKKNQYKSDYDDLTLRLNKKSNKENKELTKRDLTPDLSPKRPGRKSDDDISPKRRRDKSPKYKNKDYSPPRRTRRSPDLSPKRPGRNYDSDISPKRKRDLSPKRPGRDDSDISPKRRRDKSPKYKNRDYSPQRKTRSPDLSPKRPGKNYDSDISPKRKRDLSPKRPGRDDSDISPKRKRDKSPKYKSRDSPQRKKRSPDLSPRREKSPKYKSRNYSPQRRTRRSPDLSPQKDRNEVMERNRKPDGSTKRKSRFSDLSPVRRQRTPDLPYQRSSKSLSPENNKKNKTRNSNTPDCSPPRSSKMSKTLDGKIAGLQNAKLLRIENDKFKEREQEVFDQMTDEMSGKNAEAVMRDKSTGKKRDFEMEANKQRQLDEKMLQRKLIYDKWGKGLKQVEDYRNRIAEDIHEMNKPLARYSDDNDLDDLLKKKERIGDPMLQYMKEKDRQQRKEAGIPLKPIYEGGFPDNRFNIRPGYRWDGVDRSNGYEQKWFDVISSKKAVEEEIYRYSTEDM